jgi:uncharacterized protein (TIGR03790 family)
MRNVFSVAFSALPFELSALSFQLFGSSIRRIVALVVLCLLLSTPAEALIAAEILVVANDNEPEGVALARYYLELRQVPEENLLLLTVPVGEVCSRKAYERRVAGPVRKYLSSVSPRWKIRCVLLMLGLPLKISPPEEITPADRQRMAFLEREIAGMAPQTPSVDGTPDSGKPTLLEQKRAALSFLQKNSGLSSLDSEIALVMAPDYPLKGWIPNPYYAGHRNRRPVVAKSDVLMVSRLDGPTAAVVRRVIDDSIRTEKSGLRGHACFDARWKRGAAPETTAMGYRRYDNSLHRAARRIEDAGRLPVVLNDRSALFQPGDCPRPALYCGWYSLRTYVDAFVWQPGAVGYHIASAECTTLKDRDSNTWCKRMLEKGVAATIGPVAEPYVGAFPLPELFFGVLTDGYLTLAETYLLSLPYLSWRMVLVGDPLYRPWGKNREVRKSVG